MKKNILPQQVARILRIQEQMIPTKDLSKTRGIQLENYACRLCHKAEEGVKHWLNSCEYLARKEYLKRHDQTLRVLYVEVLKKFQLEKSNKAWFNVSVEAVRENEEVLVIWNKRMETHTRVKHRWPDLRIEEKKRKVIWIIDMSCPSDANVKMKEIQKRHNYMDLKYELKVQRPGWEIEIVPLIVGVMGGILNLQKEVLKILGNEWLAKRCVADMQKTTVLGSLQMIHRIENKLV